MLVRLFIEADYDYDYDDDDDDAGTTLATYQAMGRLRTSFILFLGIHAAQAKFSGGIGWHRDCARSRGLRHRLQGLTARRCCDGSDPHWPTLPRHSRCGGNPGACRLPQRAYEIRRTNLFFISFPLYVLLIHPFT